MYPTIDIEYELLSRKFKNPDDFKTLRDFRLKLKSEGNPKNKALKPLINGVFGSSKDRLGAMYDPLMANLTCIFGQMILLDIIDKIEPYCSIKNVNTDGIFVLCANEEMKNKVIKIINENGKRLKMEFEIDEYTKLIQKDVNNYIAVPKNPNEKIECKGKMVKYNSPIDNDLPILNDAVRNYLVNGTPVEETINNCNELIKFQKVIKLSAKYKEVWFGSVISGTDGATGIDGTQLHEKVHRVFASNKQSDGSIYKSKIEKHKKTYEKFADTPEHIFIDNGDIHNKLIPDYLDRNYYIQEAKKRIGMFLTKDDEKIDPIPNILFDCMNRANNFYEFLKNTTESTEIKITSKILETYLIADCCKIYGKTQKLLIFKSYFDILFQKNKFIRKNIEKKIEDKNILNIILNNATLSETGKTYNDFNYEKALIEIFNIIENEDINPYEIMVTQVKLFNSVRYTDPTITTDRWFVLNTRNVIKPNINIYNMKTGEIQYRKVQKEIFKILPLYDGDIIDIKSSEIQYGEKIIGKDEKGTNIIAADIDKKYDVITSYDIIYRDKSVSCKVSSDEEDCY